MKNTTKLLSIILVLGMILGTFTMLGSFGASAASAAYNGTPVTPTQISESTYASLGLAEDKWQQYNGYYAIRNASELYGFAELVNAGNGYANAVLLDDIVVNSGTVSESGSSSGTTHEWHGIGGADTNNYFRGTFDGNGHYVSGLYYKVPEGYSVSIVGFFRVLSGATVKNLTIKNTYFHAESNIGAIAGYAVGSTSNIINCRVESDVTVVKGPEGQAPNLGGILGGTPLAGWGSNWPVYCKITNCVFLGNIVCQLSDFTSLNSTNRDYIGAISGTSMRSGNAFDHVEAENCFYRAGAISDKNGNTKYAYSSGGSTYYSEFNMGIGGVQNYRSDEGCEVIESASDPHTPIVAEHKGIKSGDKDYKYCVMCGKKIATLTLTAPTSYAIPGANMPITAKADYSEVTSFTIANGTNYTVNGMTIKVSTDALVGSEITVKVTSAETANVHAAEGTIKLTVGVIDSTQEINALQENLDQATEDLKALINQKADKTELESAQNTLNQAIKDAQAAAEKAAKDGDAALETKLTNAINDAKTAITDAYTKAIEDAKTELNGLIDAAEQAAIDGDNALRTELSDKIETTKSDLEALIDAAEQAAIDADEALKLELTDVINKAKEELDNADKQLQANIDAAIKKAADELEAVRADLQTKIDANDTRITNEVAALNAAIKEAQATLEAADAKNRAELEAALAKAEVALKKSIESVSNRLNNAQKVLLNVINAGDKQLDEKITALNAALTEAIAALDTKTVEADAALKAELLATIEAADKALDEAIKAVQKNLDDAKAELAKAIADGDTALAEKLSALDAALKSAEAALKAADETNKTELLAAIEKTEADLTKLITEGDKQNADALASAMVLLRAEMEQAKKDAQLMPTIIAIVAVAGDIALAAWLVLSKKKRSR